MEKKIFRFLHEAENNSLLAFVLAFCVFVCAMFHIYLMLNIIDTNANIQRRKL